VQEPEEALLGARRPGGGDGVGGLPQPRFRAAERELRDGAIFDGRNIYDPKTVAAAGLAYYSIGRQPLTPLRARRCVETERAPGGALSAFGTRLEITGSRLVAGHRAGRDRKLSNGP